MNAEAKFDTRTLERLLREGRVTRQEVDAYLAQLPDSADAADTSAVQFVHHHGVRASFGARRDDER
jgi:hypothetical protein